MTERTHAYLRELRRYYAEHGLYPYTYIILPLALFGIYTVAFSAEGSHRGDVPWLGGDLNVWMAGVVIAGASTAVFLPSFWVPYRHRRGLLAVLSVWIIPTSFVLPTTVFLHIFSLAIAARLATTRQAVVATAVVTLVATANVFALWSWFRWPALSLWYVVPPAFAFIGWLSILDFARERMYARLKLAQAETDQLSAAQERERIARDLHDLLGHSLSLIAVKAELVERLGQRDLERTHKENRDVVRIARSALSEVRQAVDNYRAPRIKTELANADLALRSVSARLESDIAVLDLPASHEAALAYIIREAVTNVMRHAEASRCRVTLEQVDDTVHLRIHDDGRGARGLEGSGTRGMRERIAALGGRFERRDEHGTLVLVEVPLQPAIAVPGGSR